MKYLDPVMVFCAHPVSVVDAPVEQQLAEWMVDNDIDANRVMDYIRECEETVITTVE